MVSADQVNEISHIGLSDTEHSHKTPFIHRIALATVIKQEKASD